MKTKKKVFNLAVYLLSGTSLARGDTTESNGANLATCSQNRGRRPKKIKKKRSLAQNLRLSLHVHLCFSSWNEIFLTLSGAQEVFWGAFQWNRACYFLLGHNYRLGGTLLAWGEHGPEMPLPPWRRA